MAIEFDRRSILAGIFCTSIVGNRALSDDAAHATTPVPTKKPPAPLPCPDRKLSDLGIQYTVVNAETKTPVILNVNPHIDAQTFKTFRPPASLTKMHTIFTAGEVIEAGLASLSDNLTIPSIVDDLARPPIGPFRLSGATAGNTFTLEEILTATGTYSCASCAIATAVYIGEKIQSSALENQKERENAHLNTFIEAMNQSANNLGMVDTKIFTPSGRPLYPSSARCYIDKAETTPYDMALLTIALQARFPNLAAKTMGQARVDSPITTDKTHTNAGLLANYDHVKFVKTGTTTNAGNCLALYSELRGHKLAGVIMGARGGYPNALMLSILEKAADLIENPAPLPLQIPDELIALREEALTAPHGHENAELIHNL